MEQPQQQQEEKIYYRLPCYYQSYWESIKTILKNVQIDSTKKLIDVLKQLHQQKVDQVCQLLEKNDRKQLESYRNRERFIQQKCPKKYESLEQSIIEYNQFSKNSIFEQVLPTMIKYALKAENLFTQKNKEENHSLPILLSNQGNQKLRLTRAQVLAVNSFAFFNLIIEYDLQKTSPIELKAGTINFWQIQQSGRFNLEAKERLKCFYCYVQECYKSEQKLEKFFVEYYRKALQNNEIPDWKKLDLLCDVDVKVQTQGIEQSDAFYQVDFANKNLSIHEIIPSCTQEEVMFTIRPECYIAMLIFDTLQINEAGIIQGAKTYSQYTGYQRSFEFNGVVDDIEKEQISSIIAIDAFENYMNQQFEKQNLIGDIIKSYIGFKALDQKEIIYQHTGQLNVDKISTGNWGCGIFRGDFALKFLQQYIAAKLANKSLVYSSYNNVQQKKQYDKLSEALKKGKWTISELIDILLQYYQKYDKLFQFEHYIKNMIVEKKGKKELYEKKDDEIKEQKQEDDNE